MTRKLSASRAAFLAVGLLLPFTVNSIGFSGYYAPENWEFIELDPSQDEVTRDGSFDFALAPSSISLTGPDDDGGEGASLIRIEIPLAGQVIFDWDYTTTDEGGAEWDPFGYVLNDVFNPIFDDPDLTQELGIGHIVTVSVGDIFGFAIRTLDGTNGAATVTISNFTAPEMAVPIPNTIVLFSFGLIGLLMQRRHRRDKVAVPRVQARWHWW